MLLFLSFLYTGFGISSAFLCTPKKEVTQLDQLKVLSDVKSRCISDILETQNETLAGSHCSGLFDGLICWPKTRAGFTVHLQCPSYVHGFNSSGYATKQCLPSGEWFVHPIHNVTYTNFTGCIPTTPLHPTDLVSRAELFQSHMHSIQTLYRVGYAISLTFLSIAVFIMTAFSKLRCQRNTIHINLFLSFIFRCIVCFLKDENLIPADETNIMEEVIQQLESSDESWRCKLVHTLFFYFLIANYMWIFVEGVYLHTLIFITTFHNISRRMFRVLILVGWVSPLLCVMPWVTIKILYEDTLCWNLHNPDNGYYWILQGPVVATLVVNFGFFLNIVRVLFTKLSAGHSRDPKCYRKLAKSTLVLIPLFGVHYILFMAIPICLEPMVEIVWMYTELFFSSFQGFVVSMLFCFLNGEVKTEIMKHWRMHMLRRQSLVSTRSTRTMSVHSSSGKDSPTSEKRKSSLPILKGKDSSNSICNDIDNKEISETELNQNGSNIVNKHSFNNEVSDSGVSVTMTDDNEKVPFLSIQKVSFL